MSKETRVDPYDLPTLRWRLVVHRLRPCAVRAGGTHFLLSVHDELVLECLKEEARGVALWLKAKMGEAIEEILGEELGGPTTAEVGYGPSWGECVELEES
jgi:hypothetical protein